MLTGQWPANVNRCWRHDDMQVLIDVDGTMTYRCWQMLTATMTYRCWQMLTGRWHHQTSWGRQTFNSARESSYALHVSRKLLQWLSLKQSSVSGLIDDGPFRPFKEDRRQNRVCKYADIWFIVTVSGIMRCFLTAQEESTALGVTGWFRTPSRSRPWNAWDTVLSVLLVKAGLLALSLEPCVENRSWTPSDCWHYSFRSLCVCVCVCVCLFLSLFLKT